MARDRPRLRLPLVALAAALLVAATMLVSTRAFAETRLALVISNASYPSEIGKLDNPHKDGATIADALQGVGFDKANITILKDADQPTLRLAVADFVERIEKAGSDAVVFLYYSGHGAADRTDRGENYLIPVGARITLAKQLPILGVGLSEVTKALERVPAKARFVVIDACRNVAFTKGLKDATKGFVPERKLDGMIIAFATRPGEPADDNNVYASALASVLPTPGLRAEEVFKETQLKVAELSKGQQVPWTEDGLLARFKFIEKAPEAKVTPAPPAPQVAIVAPPAPPPAAPAVPARCTGVEVDVTGSGKRCLDPVDAGNREFQDCFDARGKRVCGPQMVVVPAGKFLMGSPEGETGRDNDEGPQHEVGIPRPFAAGLTHVTRGEFAAFVAATGHKTDGGCWVRGGKDNPNASWRAPGFEQDDSHPVVCVNWHDAQAYAAWLKQQTGVEYRLLTEAESEYVARATTSATRQPRYFFGDDPKDLCKYANGADLTAKATFSGWAVSECKDGYDYTAPAGHFAANAFGVKDVHGNAWSWTQDCWIENYRDAPKDGTKAVESKDCQSRVLRGGSWFSLPWGLRAADRFLNRPGYRFSYIGFRVARSVSR